MKSPIAALPLPEVYYEEERNRYYAPKPAGGYRILPAKDLDSWLVKAGFCSTKRIGGLSEVADARLRVQDQACVQLAMPLAGYQEGLITNGAIKILVTAGPNILAPIAGSFATIEALINGMLNESNLLQREVFYAWLKRGYESLRSGRFTPGQALFLAGPPGTGKTLLTLMITTILGGRSARAYGFLSGKTEFNKDVFSAEHQIIDDEIAIANNSSRRNLGAAIKNLTVSVAQRLHAKNRDAITVEPFFRLTGCLNDNAEDLEVLPPLDDSIADKLIILRVNKHQFPMPTHTAEQQEAFRHQLKAEVPAFLHFLSNWEVPAQIRNDRFGVVSFHHPELVQALLELQPENRLQHIVDHVLFARNLRTLLHPRGENIVEPPMPEAWDGTAEQLEAAIRADQTYGVELGRLFGAINNRCGIYLGRLASRRNPRVRSRIVRGQTLWTIEPPAVPSDVPPGPAAGSGHSPTV